MRNFLLLASCWAVTFALTAVDIPMKHGELSAVFDTRGGSLRSLEYAGDKYMLPGSSFSERVMANAEKNGKPAQIQECFDRLEFLPEIRENSWKKAEFSFSARGIGAFDWMRLTKTYLFKDRKPEFTILFTLKNLDSKPHSAALWTRTFLRFCDAGNQPNIYLQPRPDTAAELRHPGPAVKMDEWSIPPPEAWTAVYGAISKAGALLTFPKEKPSALYNWFSLTKTLATSEWVTGEKVLNPGESATFEVHVQLSKDIPALLKNLDKKALAAVKTPERVIHYPAFHAAGKERELATLQNVGGSLPRSARSMNFTVPRQFSSSLREALLPDGADPARCAVFEVANGRADDSREVPSRVIKDASGKNRIQFLVPGIEMPYYVLTQDAQKTLRRRSGEFVALGNFPVEIALDRAPQAKLDDRGFPFGANLVFNGDLTLEKEELKGLPAGYPTSMDGRHRHWFAWKNGELSLCRPAEKDQYVQFNIFFRVEPGMKYVASCRLRNDNRIKGVAVGSIAFFDENGKTMPNAGVNFYPGNRDSHDWKTIQQEFYAPEKAAFGRLRFGTYGIKDQTITFDDFKIVPQPYSTVEVKLADRLRDQLINSWYKPLPYIERNSHEVETPHVKWLTPAAFTLPEILYLPMVRGNYTSLERRLIVELAQRMDFRYRMIPLLGHVAYINGNGVMGVYQNTMEPRLEPYTQERLKEIKTPPRVIFVQEVDFKKDVAAPFAAFLTEQSKGGSKLLFVNCKNIPGGLLGKPLPPPAGILAIPEMKQLSPRQLSNFLSFNEKGAVFNNDTRSQRFNPSVPESENDNRNPTLAGRDFPFIEYTHLILAKVLRELTGTAPEIRILSAASDGKDLTLKLNASAAKKGKIALDMRWGNETFAQPEKELTVPTGTSEVKLPLDGFPEGESVAEFRIAGSDGKIFDAGAAKILRPETAKLSVEGADRHFLFGRNVDFTVKAAALPAGATLRVRIEDCDYRIVYDKSTTRPEMKVEFHPLPPYAVFYRIIATVEQADRVSARKLAEFTVTGRPSDPTEMLTLMWPGPDAAKHALYRKYGYDQVIVWCRANTAALRSLRSVGIEPVIYGIGTTGYTNWTAYKDDKASTPERTPCFSDPAAAKKSAENVAGLVRSNRLDYYGVRCHLIGDEQYIGSTVCFAPHCLAKFRDVLKAEFKTLDALNTSWGSSFKNWNEVTPVQVKDLTDKTHLGRWLDHKMFMNKVFAGTYMKGVRDALNSVEKGSVTGLSGTPNPGYSYDWSEVMKQLDYIAYYDGIQRKLAQDLARSGVFGGQWYGGYVAPVPHEGYCNSYFWRGLLLGANLSAIYAPRAGITGDLKLTPVLETYDKLLKESREGLSRLVLSSKERPEVAVLYSQRSFFANAGTVGANEWQNSNSGWHALLGDLGIDYRYIDSERLEKNGLNPHIFKVLILPAAIALSDKEIEQIEAFVSAGGTVIADFMPGVYDEHGALRKKSGFSARFGLKNPVVPAIASVKADTAADPLSGAPALKGEFRSASPAEKMLNTSSLGKGKFLGLNLLLGGYQAVELGGTGGETSRVVSGAEAFCRNWRTLGSGILAHAGVLPHRTLSGPDGKPREAETCWRENGGNYVFGILHHDRSIPVLDRKKGELLTVKLPLSGHIYDLRARKYLGKSDTFKLFLSPARGEFFSVMKEKVTRVELSIPREVSPGSSFTLKFRALTESKKNPGALVFHWRLTSPSGKNFDRYSGTVATGDGSGEVKLQMAFNDQPGNWQVSVRCVNAEAIGQGSFLLQKR